MPKLTFRNSPGRLVDISTVAATKVKNEFGAILEQTSHCGTVAITHHETPKAALVSFAKFESLVSERSRSLDDLNTEFDILLAHMQTPSARKGVEAALNASHAELNSATVKVDQNSCYTWSAAEFLPPPTWPPRRTGPNQSWPLHSSCRSVNSLDLGFLAHLPQRYARLEFFEKNAISNKLKGIKLLRPTNI